MGDDKSASSTKEEIFKDVYVKKFYTKEENYRAYKLFSMMDIDGGGTISLREINRVLMGESIRFVSCSFDHPDSGLLFNLDEENCVIIANIEPDSVAAKYPFLIRRMRLHRINDFQVILYDERSLQKVYQELIRLGDDPIELQFIEPVIVINKFSCVLDIEIQEQIYSITLPVGAFYNHKLLIDKIGDLMDEVSPILNNIIIEFIEQRRQMIFKSTDKHLPFRLLFQSGPNFRRSCRYALGFSAEDLPYALEHAGQPLLIDLHLGLSPEKMEILMIELFQQFDKDGSGEFEFEEFRDFYIKYLDSDESLQRLRDYGNFRFRDIERERFVLKQRQERLNKHMRKQYLKAKEATVVKAQKEKMMNDSYVDQFGIRRRIFRHRTISRPAMKRSKSAVSADAKEDDGEEEDKFSVEDDDVEEIRKEELAAGKEEERETATMTREGIALQSSPSRQVEIPPLPLTTDQEESKSLEKVEKESKEWRRLDRRRKKTERRIMIQTDEPDAITTPKAPIPPSEEEASLVSNLTKEEYQFHRQLKSREKRKQTKQRLELQQKRRKKMLAKIYQANAELKKQEMIQKRIENENAVSSTMMELHARVKRGLLQSLKLSMSEFDHLQHYSLDYSHILTSPAVTVTPAIFGQSIQSDAIEVEDLPAKTLHPAGKYYYFLKEDHEDAYETFNAEYIHPVYFNGDFVRNPTRHSSAALAMISSMKHARDEGINYRAKHGMKRVFAVPPQDELPKRQELEVKKKVRFLEPENISKLQHGLLARLTINSIKLINLVPIHVIEKNSPFASVSCGNWKSSTQIYSYAGSDCSWDDLNWSFRLHKKDTLTISVFSGTNLKHYSVGEFSILSEEIMNLPRNNNSLITIKGQLRDHPPATAAAALDGNDTNDVLKKTNHHNNKGKVMGKFEITLFIEPGQEWDWYINEYLAKKVHLIEMKHEIARFSQTYIPKGDADDVIHYPIYIEIDRILVVDVKTVHWFHKNRLYIILDTGINEVSTIDENPILGNTVQTIDDSAEWKQLNWNILITKPELKLIFKVYSANIPIGRFILSGKYIFEKASKVNKELEFFGDIVDWQNNQFIKGKISIRGFYHPNTDEDGNKLSKKQSTTAAAALLGMEDPYDSHHIEDMQSIATKLVNDFELIALPAIIIIDQIEILPVEGGSASTGGGMIHFLELYMSCLHITYEKETKKLSQQKIVKNLQWSFPLTKLMNIHVSLAWNHQYKAYANIRSETFQTVQRNSTDHTFSYQVPIHNETSFCGYIVLSGRVESEKDQEKVSHMLAESEMILLAKEEADRLGSAHAHHLLPSMMDQSSFTKKAKGYIEQKIAIPWKEIELIDIITTSDSKEYSSSFEEGKGGVSGVRVLITEVVLTDLKNKHFLKKNSPRVDFVISADCGESTTVRENAGREAIWTGLQIVLPIEPLQQMKTVVESNGQVIGEALWSYRQLFASLANEIGQRDLFAILSPKVTSNGTSKTAITTTTSDETGKIQIKFQLINTVKPTVQTSTLTMRQGNTLEFPVLAVVYNLSVLQLKSVHRFSKNSPYIKLARMSKRQNDVLATPKLHSAGSYGKWYNLFWEIILDQADTKVYFQVLSESIVIGTAVIDAQKFVQASVNKLGMSEIDCQLLGSDNVSHVGDIRILLSLEPYVDVEPSISGGDEETVASHLTPRSLLEATRPPSSPAQNLNEKLQEKWIHINEITIILNQALSAEIIQLFKQSHVKLLCGKYLQGIELFSTPNDYIVHNKKLQLTFLMNQEYPMLVTVFSETTVKGIEESSELGQCSISLQRILKNGESKEGKYIIDRDIYYGDRLMGLLLISLTLPEIIPSSAIVENTGLSSVADEFPLFHPMPSIPPPPSKNRMEGKRSVQFPAQEEIIRSEHPFWIKIHRVLINNLTPPDITIHPNNGGPQKKLKIDENYHAEELMLLVNYDQYDRKFPCAHHAGWKVMEWEKLDLIYYITNSIDVWDLSVIFDAYHLGNVTITVNDWYQKCTKSRKPLSNASVSSNSSTTSNPAAAFSNHQYELFAKIEKDGKVVGKMVIYFMKNKLFLTSNQTVVPHRKLGANNTFHSDHHHHDHRHNYLNDEKNEDGELRSLGHLRMKYIAVRNLAQIYDLFPNSPKIYFALGEYEYQTSIAYNAGSDHTWDNLSWGRIPFFPQASLKMKVMSNNEILGKVEISHSEMKQLLLEAKSILTIDRPLFDGQVYKGHIELSFYGEILSSALEEAEERAAVVAARNGNQRLEALAEEDEEASSLLSTIITNDYLSKDMMSLSQTTPTPSMTDILFLGISLTELKKVDVVQLNSPQVIMSCGNWKQETSRAFYTGSSASWLFTPHLENHDHTNKWRLSVKGSPFIRITVVSNKKQIGSSHFTLRELLSMPQDEIGLIRSVHRLETVNNMFAGFVELCYKVVNILPNRARSRPSGGGVTSPAQGDDESYHYPTLIDQFQSLPLPPSTQIDGMMSGTLLSSSLEAGKEYTDFHAPELPYNPEDSKPISLLLPSESDNAQLQSNESQPPAEKTPNKIFTPVLKRIYQYPVICTIVSIFFEDIRRQRWLKNESFSFQISNEYTSKSSSMKVSQKGTIVKVENIYWEYRLLHPTNSVAISLFSEGNLITTVSVEATEILNQEKSSQGYLEVVKFLNAQDPRAGKVILLLSLASLAPERHNRIEQLQELFETQSTADVSQTIIPKLKQEYLEQILLTIHLKVVTAQEITRMFHECKISIIITDYGKFTSPILLNPSGVLIYDCATLLPPIKLHERSYAKIIIEDKYNTLLGTAIFTINDFLYVPVEERNQMAVLYSDLTLGIAKTGLVSFAFDKFEGNVDLGPYLPPSQRKIVKTVINPDGDTRVIELPKIAHNSKLSIVAIDVKQLKTIHKYGKNSPMIQLEYFGTRFMSQCIPFAGEAANWENLFWNLTCRENAVMKFRISSSSVSIGIVYIPMKELFSFIPDTYGDIQITKEIKKDITSTNLYSQNYNSYSKSTAVHGMATFTIRHLSWQFKPKLLSTIHEATVDGGPSVETVDSSLHHPTGSSIDGGGLSVEESILQRNIVQFQKLGITAVINRFEDTAKSIQSMITDSIMKENSFESNLDSPDSLSKGGKEVQFDDSTTYNSSYATSSQSFYTSSQAPEFSEQSGRNASSSSFQSASTYTEEDDTQSELRTYASSYSGTGTTGSPFTRSFHTSPSESRTDTFSPSRSSYDSESPLSKTPTQSQELTQSYYSTDQQSSSNQLGPMNSSSILSQSHETSSAVSLSRPRTSRGPADAVQRSLNSVHPQTSLSASLIESSSVDSSVESSSLPSYTLKNPSAGSIYSNNAGAGGGKSKIKEQFSNVLPSITEYSTSSDPNKHSLLSDDTKSRESSKKDFVIMKTTSNIQSQKQEPKEPASLAVNITSEHPLFRRYLYPREKIVRGDTIPNFSYNRLCTFTAYQFVTNIVSQVLCSFIALEEGEDYYQSSTAIAPTALPLTSFNRFTNRRIAIFITATRYIETSIQHAATKVTVQSILMRKTSNVSVPAELSAQFQTNKSLSQVPSAPQPPSSPLQEGKSAKRKGILMASEKVSEVKKNKQNAEALQKKLEEAKEPPFRLERAIINGIEQLIPQKSRLTILDIIGIDISGIDLRIIPTRPYLTACKPYSNWSAETNPTKIDLTPESMLQHGKDLFLLNYYNVSIRFKWEPCILRRGQEIIFNLHDANSGLVFAKCSFPYELIYKFPLSNTSLVNNLSATSTAGDAGPISSGPVLDSKTIQFDSEFISTNYLLFTIANEFGGGSIGGVIRFHIDLSVNHYQFEQRSSDYWSQHRSQHWGIYPLPPITYGMIRQKYPEISQAYDHQELIHPSLFGMKIRYRGNISDESKFIHPIFHNYNLAKKILFQSSNAKESSSASVARQNALLKKSKPNPFLWDPSEKERGNCVICRTGLIGCPRCFMMPLRDDGSYYYPGEFAYDPEKERKKLMEMEKKLIEINIQKSRQLQKLDYLKQQTAKKEEEGLSSSSSSIVSVKHQRGKKQSSNGSYKNSDSNKQQSQKSKRSRRSSKTPVISSITEDEELTVDEDDTYERRSKQGDEQEEPSQRSEESRSEYDSTDDDNHYSEDDPEDRTEREEEEDDGYDDVDGDEESGRTSGTSDLQTIEELREDVSRTYDQTSLKLTKSIRSLSIKHTKNSKQSVTSISIHSGTTPTITLSGTGGSSSETTVVTLSKKGSKTKTKLSAAIQSAESSMSSHIEEKRKKQEEEDDLEDLLAKERANLPPFHTNLTTFNAIRNFRLTVQPIFNVYIKVFPTGYIKRFTCTAWDTIFQLYHLFNTHSSFGNAHSSMILLPLNTGLLEFHPELAFHTDLIMADKRGYDLLQDFKLNEPFQSYVLLYIQNYQNQNMLKLLEVYFNKNTTHPLKLSHLQIFTGNDQLPKKISEDIVQQYLLKIISYEYISQQKDLQQYYQQLGKEYKKNFFSREQREVYYEQLKQTFMNQERENERKRFQSQMNRLENKRKNELTNSDLDPKNNKKDQKKKQKRNQALLKRQLTRKRQTLFLQVDEQDQQEDDDDDQQQQQRRRQNQFQQPLPTSSQLYAAAAASGMEGGEDEVSLSDIILADQQKYEKDRQRDHFMRFQAEERMFEKMEISSEGEVVPAEGPEQEDDDEEEEEIEVLSDLDDIDEIIQSVKDTSKHSTPLTTSTPSRADSSDNIPVDLPMMITSRSEQTMSSLNSFSSSRTFDESSAHSLYTRDSTYRDGSSAYSTEYSRSQTASSTASSSYYYDDHSDETSFVRSLLSNYSSSTTRKSAPSSAGSSSVTSDWVSATSSSYFTSSQPSSYYTSQLKKEKPDDQRRGSAASSVTFESVDHISLQSGGSLSSGNSSLFSGYRKSAVQSSVYHSQPGIKEQSQSRSWIHPSNTITNTLTSDDLYSHQNEPLSSSASVTSAYSSQPQSALSSARSRTEDDAVSAASRSRGGLFTYRSAVSSSNHSDVSLNSTYSSFQSVRSSVAPSTYEEQRYPSQQWATTEISSQVSRGGDRSLASVASATSSYLSASYQSHQTATTADDSNAIDFEPSQDSIQTKSSGLPSLSHSLVGKLHSSIYDYSLDHLQSPAASIAGDSQVSNEEYPDNMARNKEFEDLSIATQSLPDTISVKSSSIQGRKEKDDSTVLSVDNRSTALSIISEEESSAIQSMIPSIQQSQLTHPSHEEQRSIASFSSAGQRSVNTRSSHEGGEGGSLPSFVVAAGGGGGSRGSRSIGYEASQSSVNSKSSSGMQSVSRSIREQLSNSIAEFSHHSSPSNTIDDFYRNNALATPSYHSDESTSLNNRSRFPSQIKQTAVNDQHDMETIHSYEQDGATTINEEQEEEEEGMSLNQFDSQSLPSLGQASQQSKKK